MSFYKDGRPPSLVGDGGDEAARHDRGEVAPFAWEGGIERMEAHKKAAPRRRRRGAATEGGGYGFCKEEDVMTFAVERTDSARHL